MNSPAVAVPVTERLPCGTVMTCSRPQGHRGHCGGFRTIGLSGRQLEVLRHYGSGMGIKEAAARLGMREQTAKNHLTQIYSKLDVDGVLRALQVVGWLQIPDDHRL